MNESDFFSFFNGRIKERGLNLKKLSELSGISLKHLEALSYGDFAALPPAPYFRGYLVKLGSILDFDPELWWSKIKENESVKYGLADRPPANRFIKPQFTKFIWAGAAGAALLIYFFIQLPRIFGTPGLRVIEPSKNPAVSTSSVVTLIGTVSGANELTLNGEAISVHQDGTWEKNALLEPGLNSLELRARKFLGGETKILEQIIYQPENTSTSN